MFQFKHYCDIICKKLIELQFGLIIIKFDVLLTRLLRDADKTSRKVIFELMW